ncbi:lipoprotein insertase outer membrane protein LolB [Citrobacter sp. Cs237]|uniref:lipoprotein insertase outer membrane protein LolB n=1 Tax=Citrobacter TaxID=544 RepID=UPI001BA52383|nr:MULTISPECIES: lipoprotein insertase outer membrane protein LolB [Citrobacter]EKJ8217627.1 lipoprotein localization protein LolB [Citrobacter sedlakii]MDM2748862.1 lipoprotein insertase outer membrane protein LolB [Citrobacter sp. Cs237]QUC32025.1 lipoprotein localization protein LolB [Citrobacter sedlakii]HBU8848658.1 lipoprotein localization protein LolB [Citrobacter sedlakii]HCT5821800.1 lipoprotein localization protein LolB [Citrobacter sedlakii]
MTLPDFRLIRLLPLASLVLTACTINAPKGPGKSPDSPQWRQHQQAVLQLNQYQTRGAFAFISDDQKVYARFFWQQTGQDRYRLLLTNPLGSTELELNAQPGHVQLVDNKGQRYTAEDGEAMIGKLTGMPIPLNSLRQWILGLPGDATDYKLDDQYRLREVNYRQDGKNWKVVYSAYDSKTQPAMPANMELSDGDLRIKLKMDNWIVK